MSKKKAYVIGDSVSTSLSPIIFQHWFKKHNIDGEYEYLEIQEKDLHKKIMILLKERGLVGLNVTIPFKEKIISYLTSQDEHATEIKAVNCVTINNNNTISGTNTDWIGFMNVLENFVKERGSSGKLPKEKHNIEKYGPNHEKTKYLKAFQHDTAAVVGYGGAGKAVVYSLVQMGFRRIKVFNRTLEKIKNIETSVVKPFRLDALLNHTLESGVIVNTIPNPNILGELGLSHNNYDQIIDHYNVGVDINYGTTNKTGTGLFNNYFFSAHRIHGIDMLVSQAAPCFESWFGVLPKINDPELRSKLLKIMRNE